MTDPTLLAALAALLFLLVTAPPFDFALALAGGGDDEPPPPPARKPWEDALMFKKGGGSSAPDPDPRIGEAALRNAELGQGWLDFAREQFEIGNERQKGIDDLTERVAESQLDTQDQSNRWAQQDRDRWERLFQPLEERFVQDAEGWDSEARQGQMAAEARADVQRSAAGQREQSQRQMASMGVNPNSGRFQGQERSTDLQTALASAGAQNTARNQVRREGMALRADAANMGRGLPSQAASAAGLGLTAGNAATGNTMAGQAAWAANQGVMGQGYSGAMQGQANQGNILGNLYANQLGAWRTEQNNSAANAQGLMGGIGQLGSAAITAWSSKELKENKQPVDGALEAVKAMPVEAWDYKPGVADEGRHIGPYAEDFQAATGRGDGKTIPVIDQLGITMKAVQELDAKVERLAANEGGRRKGRAATAAAARGLG